MLPFLRQCPEALEVIAGARKGGDEPGKLPEQEEEEEEEEEEESQVLHGTGHCKWFNVRMGFGFISMLNREGSPLETPVDVFVHQSKLYMEGFRSLKEGEPVEFTFKKSSKGLESIRVTGPGGIPCLGSERRPKGKTVQKRKPKGDRKLSVMHFDLQKPASLIWGEHPTFGESSPKRPVLMLSPSGPLTEKAHEEGPQMMIVQAPGWFLWGEAVFEDYRTWHA
uniref:protein lin-28 homolog B isoform X6 n=1 Tax=Podarcis muralis TaxID=64176 RepID=UPI00109F059F|nr:protein lin-28 homolog B isoform X6 [Podarcis muralis]